MRTNEEPGPARQKADLADRNARVTWERFAAARGHRVTSATSLLAVSPNHADDRAGTRIIVNRDADPELTSSDLRTVDDHGPAAFLAIEDNTRELDLSAAGFTLREMPVMFLDARHRIRVDERAKTPGVTVERIREPVQLAEFERILIEQFPLPQFLPFSQGQMFPPAMLEMRDVTFYRLTSGERIVAGCMTVLSDGGAGMYWVVTDADHRSRGLGSRLLSAVLDDLSVPWVTLTASEQGLPLYLRHGFEVVAMSHWWQRRAVQAKT
jgi:GNAT superfamily N-acetyltransferase